MNEKAMKRYEETKNKRPEAIGDNQITEPAYEFTKKPKVHVKSADLKDREDLDIMVSDYTSKSIAKENNNTSTKKEEIKLKTTSDKEC